MPLELVVATRNRKKAAEMVALVAPSWERPPVRGGLVARTLDELPPVPDVEEDAETFLGNARKKACETARALGAWVVADDSGLAVDALDGAPGVYSARFAGTHGDDAANNRKLLLELSGVPDDRRGAAFVCALVLSDPSGASVFETEARCRGRIVHEIRGDHGFGYDPLFLIPEYHRTFGELGAVVKHHLSHRARAFSRLRPVLSRLEATGAFSGMS